MKDRSKIILVQLLRTLGAFVVLFALCFQLLVDTQLFYSGDLTERDSITCVIEKDGPAQSENFEKLEFYQVSIRHTTTVSVAMFLTKGLANKFGRANVPHSNRSRYILFQNPKLDCAV
ncbi:MAG TPA: hypothetical protein DIW47_00410 [Bacteroidetes bacterium]|nr:hypothetical protein [Bacteroidota bacterium]